MQQGPQPKSSGIVLVALGSNATSKAGGALATIRASLLELANTFGDLRVSALYQTPAFPAGSGPDFVNAAAAFESSMAPADILAHLHKIEADFARTREKRWGPRTLDIDLIACGGKILPDQDVFDHWQNLPPADQQALSPDCLILPHPRLQDRPFVLVPLADIAPDWVHPVLKQSVSSLLNAHSDAARAEIRPVS